jgi:hypothetical protein
VRGRSKASKASVAVRISEIPSVAELYLT